MSEMILIQFNGHKNLGDEYHGNDEGRTLDMRTGRPMLVSVEKAKQLIKDFGIAFSRVSEEILSAKQAQQIAEERAKIVEQKSDDKKEPKKSKVRRTVIRRRKGKKASRHRKGG